MSCSRSSWSEIQSAGKSEKGVRDMVRHVTDADHDYSMRPGRQQQISLTRRDTQGDGLESELVQRFQNRKNEIVAQAKNDSPIIFNSDEQESWKAAFGKTREQNMLHAFNPQRDGIIKLEAKQLLGGSIPSMQDVSKHLEECTGFRLLPACGYVRMHVFFLALKYKCFVCSPHVRMPQAVAFSKDPDYFHEVIGHCVALQDSDFARLQQLLGEVAYNIMQLPEELGAKLMKKLGKIYWFTFETGICKEAGHFKSYGAAILSSSGESEHAFAAVPDVSQNFRGTRFRPWDTKAVLETSFTDQKYQPMYYVADSYHNAIELTVDYWRANGDELMCWASKPLKDLFQPHVFAALGDAATGAVKQIPKCSACGGNKKRVVDIDAYLGTVPSWQVNDNKLVRTFQCKNFLTALAFFNKAGEIAEQKKHHPDLQLKEYRNVAVEIFTHKIGGLTEDDFELARSLDTIIASYLRSST